MVSKDKRMNLICYISVLFPLLNIILSLLNNNAGLMKLFFIIAVLEISYSLMRGNFSKIKMSKSAFVAIGILTIILIWIFLFDNDYYSRLQCMLFFVSMLILIVQTNSHLPKYALSWVLGNKKIIYTIRFLYYFVIILSFISGKGSGIQWTTLTLQGPYSASHILAYELLIFLSLDAIYYIKTKEYFDFVLLFIDSGLVILTAARVAFIPLVIIWFCVYKKAKSARRLFIVSLVIVVGGITFRYTNLFNACLIKTKRAIATSSITSGRGDIFISSLKAHYNAPITQRIFGMGMRLLGEFNRNHVWMDIHAHNDFIDALAQYGFLGVIVYINIFVKLIRINKLFISVLIIFSLAFFNGYYVSNAAVLGTVIFMALDETCGFSFPKNCKKSRIKGYGL